MNYGAAIATGEILLFLHSDTRLPTDFIEAIKTTLSRPEVIAGAFRLQIDDPQPSLRWIERMVQWRSQFFSLPYGDQAVFVTRQAFDECGGFPDFELMEDVALGDRLKKLGWPVLLEGPVEVGARRWKKNRAVRQTVKNWYLFTRYRLGSSPKKLANLYRRHDHGNDQPAQEREAAAMTEQAEA